MFVTLAILTVGAVLIGNEIFTLAVLLGDFLSVAIFLLRCCFTLDADRIPGTFEDWGVDRKCRK